MWCSETGVPVGFQFTYDKGKKERALTWKSELGFVHDDVDDGESHSKARHKATPLLFADGQPDIDRILHLLLTNGINIPPDIASFLTAKICEYDNRPLVQRQE